MTRDQDVPLLNVGQAAVHARVSERTVGRWIKNGLLFIPEGKEKLIPLDHLQRRMRQSHYDRRSHPTRQKPVNVTRGDT